MRTLTNEELTNLIRSDTDNVDHGIEAIQELVRRVLDGRAVLVDPSGDGPTGGCMVDCPHCGEEHEVDTY